ncbi:MAG: DUF5677 domain-containing protein [Burkholderiaceae bacterium]
MDKQSVLGAAQDRVEWLRSKTNYLEFPSSPKAKAASACFGITLDHHQGIIVLIDAGIFAPALALVRAAFEAYVRGAWLWQCATEMDAEDYLAGGSRPNIERQLRALENAEPTAKRHLSKLKQAKWAAMSGFTHAGGLHAQRWLNDVYVEANYAPEELKSAVAFSELIGAVAAVGLAEIAGNDLLAQAVHNEWMLWVTNV